MKTKIFIIFTSILISLSFISCEKYDAYEVYWRDFRANQDNEELTMACLSDNWKKLVKINCNETTNINLPQNYKYYEFYKPGNFSLNYIVDSENKKMEIFLLDYEDVKIEDNRAILNEKENVYAYFFETIDLATGKNIIACSCDNKIDISKKVINTDTELRITDMLNIIGDEDYTYTLKRGAESDENFPKNWIYYLVKGSFFNEYFLVTSKRMGRIPSYFNKEKIPNWILKQ